MNGQPEGQYRTGGSRHPAPAVVDADWHRHIGGLAEQLDTQSATTSLAKAFRLLIASDPGTADGLTPTASTCLMRAAHTGAAAMIHDDEVGRLTDDRLAALLGRGEGVELVTWAVIAPVLTAFGLAEAAGDVGDQDGTRPDRSSKAVDPGGETPEPG